VRYVDELTSAVREQLALVYRTKDLFGFAVRQRLAEGYSWADFRNDARASAELFLLALPLTLALAVALDVPPQFGLYGAMIGGITTPLLGGSRFLVTGTTAALTVVLLPVVHQFGMTGLLLTGLFSGIILVALGVARFGRFMQLIPHPVTTGLVAGIAVLLALSQISDLLGLAQPHVTNVVASVGMLRQQFVSVSGGDMIMVAVTSSILLALRKLDSRIPVALIAILSCALTATLLRYVAPSLHVATIGSAYEFRFADETIRGIPPLPPLPSVSWLSLDYNMIRALLPSAFAVAVLTAITSSMAAVVADGARGSQHEPNADLIALGVANISAPFFGGVAIAGAVARTTRNVRTLATSPFAAALHAGWLLVAVVLLAPLLAHVPLAALATLLVVVSYHMFEARHIARLIRVAPRSDVAVMLVCFALTVFFDITTAISIGLALAALLFMRRMAILTKVSIETRASETVDLPPGVTMYEIAGPMFFGAANTAFSNMRTRAAKSHTVIISMRGVPIMDATGLVALESTLDRLQRDGQQVILCALQPDISRFLDAAGIKLVPGKLAFAPDSETAVKIAVGRHRAASSSDSTASASASFPVVPQP
jgi:sulfate permease, SulP family